MNGQVHSHELCIHEMPRTAGGGAGEERRTKEEEEEKGEACSQEYGLNART